MAEAQACAQRVTTHDECRVSLRRFPPIEAVGLAIRKEKDRQLIKKFIALSDDREKRDIKLNQEVFVNILREYQLDIGGHLFKAMNDPQWKKNVQEWQNNLSKPIPSKFRAVKGEFEFFCAKRKQEPCKPGWDFKLALLHQIHGRKYKSWGEAREKGIEDQKILNGLWKKHV